MAIPVEGTEPRKSRSRKGPMRGVAISVFESSMGTYKIPIVISELPLEVQQVIRSIKDNLSRIFYHGKAIIHFHCWSRMHKFSYIIEESGCGWVEKNLFVCAQCGSLKEIFKEDLSGVPF